MNYFAHVSYPSGHSREIGAETLDEAIELAKAESAKPGFRSVRVYGDGYDVDCDQDGYFVCDDGLTDDERERVEEAGI